MLNIKTIEDLKRRKVIELVEASNEDMEAGTEILREQNGSKAYKVAQSEAQMQIELLNECAKSLQTIKYILMFFVILLVVPFLFFILKLIFFMAV